MTLEPESLCEGKAVGKLSGELTEVWNRGVVAESIAENGALANLSKREGAAMVPANRRSLIQWSRSVPFGEDFWWHRWHWVRLGLLIGASKVVQWLVMVA